MRTKEEKQYLKYIFNHRKTVKKVWKTLDQFLKDEFWLDDYYWFTIDNLIKNHDKSKYDNEEFKPYRYHFYPEQNTDIDPIYLNRWFSSGWNFHQKKNRHHWQYWVLIDDSGRISFISIPIPYIIEMLCDWTAMSLFYKNLPSDWYNKNKENMMIEDDSKNYIKRWLPLFDKVYEILKEE